MRLINFFNRTNKQASLHSTVIIIFIRALVYFASIKLRYESEEYRKDIKRKREVAPKLTVFKWLKLHIPRIFTSFPFFTSFFTTLLLFFNANTLDMLVLMFMRYSQSVSEWKERNEKINALLMRILRGHSELINL